MKKKTAFLSYVLLFALATTTYAQQYSDQQKDSIFKELKEKAIVSRKLMVPMGDGIKLSTNIYRPKTNKKVPIIFVRTPYNFNRWRNGKRQVRTALAALRAIKHGYAYIIQNEHGRYFSQGKWNYLGAPLSEASDMFSWMRNRSWSNGKIGLFGCSSTAEWQLGAASVDNAADAMVPMGYGAGIGKVGRYYHQGDWFQGGVVVFPTISWEYGTEQDNFRPQVPDSATQEDLIRISRFYDLAAQRPPIDWRKVIYRLPIDSMFSKYPKEGLLNKQRYRRKPNDSDWYRGAMYDDDMSWNVPSFWFASWYGTFVSPNLALFNYVRKHGASKMVQNNQYMVISPNLHCGYFRTKNPTIIGKRNLGNAQRHYYKMIYKWFDYWLKGKKNNFTKNTPHVQYYTMGSNKWQSAKTWPPENTKKITLYLRSNGHANSRFGDGELTTEKPGKKDNADRFTYDPGDPVIMRGGAFCCAGNAIQPGPGAFDQTPVESRNDVLVYTTEPLKKGVEVSGWVDPTLYISSDAKDTDFNVRLIDVYPNGKAFNLRSSIMRARYRKGFDKEVFMKKGKVYKLHMLPIATSNYFGKGHEIRIEIESDNFPRFTRNLNTGGNNYNEKKWIVAHNRVHHSTRYPSHITLYVKKDDLPVKFK